MGVAAVIAAASLAYSVVSNESAKRQAEHAADTAQAQAQAEIAERNRLATERTAAVTAEAERQRALAISNQEAQNVRISALAAEAAATEKAIARNLLERSQEEALITTQESAREAARVRDAQAQTQGRQLAALAAGGVDTSGEGGTTGAILLDTRTRAGKDITALEEATAGRVNLLTRQGAFAAEQGEASARNILESAGHATKTNIENVRAAADTLVENARISGATEMAMANLQNLMTAASAQQFSQQMDRLRSEANARMWGQILNTGSGLLTPRTTSTSLLT